MYVGSDDHNVYALDKSAGTVLWKYPAPGPVIAMTYDDEHTKRLYVCSQSSATTSPYKGRGVLESLDVTTTPQQAPTAPLWQWVAPLAYNLAQQYPAGSIAYLNTAPVVSSDGDNSYVIVVAGSKDAVGVNPLSAIYGLNAVTGKKIWASDNVVPPRQGEGAAGVPEGGYNPCAAPAVVQDSCGNWWAATGGQMCQPDQSCGALTSQPCNYENKCLWGVDSPVGSPLPPAALTFWKPEGDIDPQAVPDSFVRFTEGDVWKVGTTSPCGAGDQYGCGAVLAPNPDVYPDAAADSYILAGLQTSPFEAAVPLTSTSNLKGKAVFAAGKNLYAFMLNAAPAYPRLPSLLSGGRGTAAQSTVAAPLVELPDNPQAMTFSRRASPREGMLSQYVHVASTTEVWSIPIDTDPNEQGDKVVEVGSPRKYPLTPAAGPSLPSVCGQKPETCCGTQPKQVQLLSTNDPTSDYADYVFVATAAGKMLALNTTNGQLQWQKDSFGGVGANSPAADSVSLALDKGLSATSKPVLYWGGPRSAS